MLHHFIPEAEASPSGRETSSIPSIVVVPIGERDVLRAAFVWNLAVEIARAGVSADIVAPAGADPAALWPQLGAGPLGTEVAVAPAAGPAELARAALARSNARAAEPRSQGLVLARVPPGWLSQAAEAADLFRRSVFFTAPQRRDLLETYALVKRLLRAAPGVRVGVVIHGVRRLAEAEQAFSTLARAAARHQDARLTSYGLLVDDLQLVRSIVSRRPVGVTHPQSPAARALRDVARLLLGAARAD